MTTKEVVSVQIGHYANFVGAHLWNLQESSFMYDVASGYAKQRDINHDVLFREGKTRQGQVTFTPRLVAFDLKGSLQSLKREGTLYELTNQSEQEEIQWSGDVTLHQTSTASVNPFLGDLRKEEESLLHGEEMADKSQTIEDVEMKDSAHAKQGSNKSSTAGIVFGKPYYNLDDSVRVWSDYLRVHLHPKSIHVVEKFTMADELHPFDVYGCGEEVMRDYDTRQDIEDRIQYFTEECDQLQGFHVLLDTHNGFGGIGSEVLQYLEDEYSSKGVMTFGLTPSNLKDDTAQLRADRIINSAITYSKCCTHSSLYFPLSLAQSLWKTIGPPVHLPYLQYKNIDYHTSAILAATLETASLPWRHNSAIHIRDISDNFSMLGRKLGSISTSLPYPMRTDEGLIKSLQSLGEMFPWQCITPHVQNKLPPFMQSVVLRGVDPRFSGRPSNESMHQSSTTTEDIVQRYLLEKFPSCTSGSCISREQSHVTTPFPHIFSKDVNKHGLLSDKPREEYEGVESVPMMTSMQSTLEMGNLLNTLHSCAAKLNIKKHTRFLEAGLEEDEYRNIIQELQALEHCYNSKDDMG